MKQLPLLCYQLTFFLPFFHRETLHGILPCISLLIYIYFGFISKATVLTLKHLLPGKFGPMSIRTNEKQDYDNDQMITALTD